jgi:hypothetical protein
MRSALLISTYEMGRQPFGLASAAAWLRAAGWTVDCVDAAKEKLRFERLGGAELIAFHLPMHTATRLAGRLIAAARGVNRSARICAFGLYAPLNADWLRGLGVDEVFGGEFEQDLAAWANTQSNSFSTISAVSAVSPASSDRRPLPRIHFLVPDRSGLPPLSKYATLQMPAASGARWATRKPAADAVISAAIVRSCRCMKGSSASCSPTSCWPTSPRR